MSSRWARLGLPDKFILAMSGLIALTALALGWFFTRHDIDLITNALLNRGRSLVRNLAFNLDYELQYATEQRLNELIEGVIKQEDVFCVVVRDSMGNIRAQAKADQLKAIPPLRRDRLEMQVPPGGTTPPHGPTSYTGTKSASTKSFILSPPRSNANGRRSDCHWAGKSGSAVGRALGCRCISRRSETLSSAYNGPWPC